MKGLQTPKKDYQITNRRSKSVAELNKKLSKVIIRKSLDPSFPPSLGDDAVLESPGPEEFLEQYELSEVHHLDESSESFLTLKPLLPISSHDLIDSSDLMLSSASTVTKHVVGDNSAIHSISFETENSSDRASTVDVEIDLLVNHLKQAQNKVLISTGTDLLSKKLLDKLLDVVVEDFIGLPKENDHFEKLLAMKFGTLLFGFMLLFLIVAVLFYCLWEESSYSGPTPT